MKFKAFEVYITYGEHNSSMSAIEQRGESLVNDWLARNPGIRIDHFSQSLADINGSIVLQLGRSTDSSQL